jgi:16S rRNA C967 or C1407 C5-methylase (RsmB/RsmF family)/NOL1/NOP2/fmu family ribosome biogenesis protein
LQLPEEFLTSLENAPGFNRVTFTDCHIDSTSSPVSIRVNPAKKEALDHKLTGLERVPWCNNGYYLPQRPVFTLDPLFHAGAYYVQEASSMFLEHVIRQLTDARNPIWALDLCAAPGGKSTLIQSILHPDSLLVSNEVIQSRVSVLEENLIKWGGCNTIVTNNDARDFLSVGACFDLVLVDAPCSGSGLFRKDEKAIREWSPPNVEHCAQRQKRILQDLIPVLKQDGILIYSTCSFSTEENEEVVKWICEQYAMEVLPISLDASWNIVESPTGGYRFYPDRVKGEGFFLAACRKKGPASQTRQDATDIKYGKLLSKELSAIENWGVDTTGLVRLLKNDEIVFMPAEVFRAYPHFQKYLRVRRVGVKVGKLIREQLLPDPELAFSSCVQSGFPVIEADVSMALDFLRKKTVTADGDSKGWHLLRFMGLGLGWLKLMDGRSNNYYPMNWRILNL